MSNSKSFNKLLNDIRQFKMCGRKQSFDSKAKAIKKGTKFKQRVYQCPHCNNYHLTKRTHNK